MRAPPLPVWLLSAALLAPPLYAQNVKVIEAEATYVMGDSDTLVGAEEAVLLRAKRKAVEEAGVYVEAVSQDVETRANGTTSRLNSLGVRTIAAAITQTDILEKRRTLEKDRLVFYVRIRATVHLDALAEAVKRVTSDEQLASHHRQLQTENSQLKTELNSLRKQLKAAAEAKPDPAKEQKSRQAAMDLERAAIRTTSLPEKIDLASRAIAADERYVDAYVVRGQTYLRIASLTFSKRAPRAQLGEYVDRAIADFNRALALDPTSTWALLGRGDAYTWQKKMQEAARDYESILELDPFFDVARERLIALSASMAKKQVAAKQWRQALATLNQVLRDDSPQSWIVHEKDARLLRSRIHAELGNLDRAVTDLSAVIRVEPANTEALLLRAKLYRRQLQGRLARDDFEQACSLGAEEACAELP
jgi:tetratricopeptide (TPR) repeat protein